jgi:hypothetical protein
MDEVSTISTEFAQEFFVEVWKRWESEGGERIGKRVFLFS